MSDSLVCGFVLFYILSNKPDKLLQLQTPSTITVPKYYYYSTQAVLLE